MANANPPPPSSPATARVGGRWRMIAAMGLSTFGDGAATVTLTLRIQGATHSSLMVCGLLVAILGPSVAGAPIAGRVISRSDPRRVIVVAACLQSAVACGLALVTAPDPTLILATALGCGFAFSVPATLALVPRAFPDDEIVRVNSMLRTADWVACTVGPLAGGALVTAGYTAAPLLIDAASFLAAAAGIGRIRLVDAGDQADRGSRRHPGAALLRVLADRPLMKLTLICGGTGLFDSIASISEVFLAREVLRVSAFGFAALGAAWTAGSVAGALLAPAVFRRRPGAATVGLVLAGAGIAAAGAAPSLALALAPYALAGVAFGVQLTIIRSMVQRHVAVQVPQELRGQAFSAYAAVAMGSQLAGFACGAAVIATLGTRPAMWVAGAGTIAVGTIGSAPAWLRVRRPGRSAQWRPGSPPAAG
jgi:MFS family permease